MKRPIHAVLLVLALASVGPASAAPQDTAGQPAGDAPVARTAQDGTFAAPVIGPDDGSSTCLDRMSRGLLISPPLSQVAQPQVGAPCCVDLCEQICGVGEACLCKRCQVLGCGV